jgi:Ca2+-dependent lipid-binding protein
MFTLPNRYLVKLDAKSDYFKSYLYPAGIVRVTVENALGFAEEATSSTKKLFHKLTRAHPDCFTEVTVGGEEPWRTSTKNNTTKPTWNETHDFVVSDFDQCIKLDVEDHDVNANDEVGIAVTTIREILLAGNRKEMPLIKKGEETDGKVTISCHYFKFDANSNSFSASDHKGDGKMCGLATILVAGAYDIEGPRKELSPSVVVTWGEKNRFQTAVKTDAPGTDINNPSFDQNFRVPITTDMVGKKAEKFRIALMNGEKEVGGVDVPFDDVLNAPDMVLQKLFGVGSGATVKASICLRGIGAETTQ